MKPGEWIDGVPTPYNEDMEENKRWVKDFSDNALPRTKGFITDFVYHLRGFETPTLSCIWTAAFIMESAIKRECWLQWVDYDDCEVSEVCDDNMYTNQYMLIIGPAGVVKKTTAITKGLKVLDGAAKLVSNTTVKAMKRYKVIMDKVTPEGLLESMLPRSTSGSAQYVQDAEGNFVTDSSGKAIKIPATSEASIIVSELSTLLTKSTYAATMAALLIDLYDTRDTFHWTTKGEKEKVLRYLHTTLLAGTTVAGLRESIPTAAKGDGFLSRSILIYVPDTLRDYAEPFYPKDAPSLQELQRRLAWIIETSLGAYTYTEEAKETFRVWYKKFRQRLREDPEMSGIISRMDSNVRKLSLIFRLQRYDMNDTFITSRDVEDAIRLIEVTYRSTPFLLSQISEDFMVVVTGRVAEYIQKRGSVVRGKMLSATRSWLKADMLSMAIEELVQRGQVRITEAEQSTEVVYEWSGEEEDGARYSERAREISSRYDNKGTREYTTGRHATRRKSYRFAPLPQSAATRGPGRPRGSANKKAGSGTQETEPKGEFGKMAGGEPGSEAS